MMVFEEFEGRRGTGQRLDRWLWFARVAKSRTLAAALVSSGKIRVNRLKSDKPSQIVRPGDVITSAATQRIRVLRILATGVRRGPAAEAAALYEELTPPNTSAMSLGGLVAARVLQGGRMRGAGRPTKRDRRQIDRLKGGLN